MNFWQRIEKNWQDGVEAAKAREMKQAEKNRNVIQAQRCFKIPKEKLDLFLVQLSMVSDGYTHHAAEYIFDNGDIYYDVVVYQRGNPRNDRIQELGIFAGKL